MRRAGRAAIWAAVAAAGLGVVGAVPAFGTASATDSRGLSRPLTGLVERAQCAGDQAAPVSGSVAVDAAAAVQLVSVVVPPVALLDLDADGGVIAAATNTGCAPRLGDAVYVVQADGSLVPGALPVVDWVGDFTEAGVFQPQS